MQVATPPLTHAALRAAAGDDADRAARWLAPMAHACAAFGIDTPVRQAAFLAQIGHESGRLRYVREIWGPTPAQSTYERDFAAPWVRLVGGQRHRNTKPFDLGNVHRGDGRRYLGRGLIQTTGRANYAATRAGLRAHLSGADVPDFEADPVQLELPHWAALSAAWYWHSRSLIALADLGTDAAFLDMTRRINGGTNGLADRRALWTAVRQALGV